MANTGKKNFTGVPFDDSLYMSANMFDDGGYKYYMKPSDAGYYAPEVRVTPSGSGPAAILENGDYGVTAGTLNYMGVPIYEEGKELNNNQYRTQPTNAEASHLADDMVSATEFKPWNILPLPIGEALDKIANLSKYTQAYVSNRLGGEKDEIIDLSDSNVSRITSNTPNISSILGNEFLEKNANTVRTKKEFENTTDTLLGDKNIPLSKVTTFYGIEDGKLKAGPLDIFKENTYVVPNRAPYVGKITGFYPGKVPSAEARKAFREQYREGLHKYVEDHGYSGLGATFWGPLKAIQNNEGRKRMTEVKDSIKNEYAYVLDGRPASVITENGDTINGYNINATPKTFFTDEEGNAIFVSNPSKSLEQLNEMLKANPRYPIMIDNGRYSHYQTENPNIDSYVGLANPDDMYIIGTTKEQGGSLNTHKKWEDLSMKERGEMIRVAVRNGITDLSNIKEMYNEFAMGGNIYDGTTQNTQQMQTNNSSNWSLYETIPRLFALDGVKVWMSSGHRPGAVVHGTNRKSRHSLINGAVDIQSNDYAAVQRVLNNPNSYVSKWMLEHGYGYLDETSATGTTKYWHDHNRDHSHYHIGEDYAKQYASNMKSTSAKVGHNNYRSIAKQFIKENEGWRTNPYADGPNGWRSVGYGFNDSGFYAKYPQGISNYYAQKGGISKAEAEQELDWYLDRMESTLRKTYGKKWDSFTDNQKAAIMDTAYQKPASVDAKSAFYNAVMSGNPNAVNYLGVAKYDDRNADRRSLFNSSAPIIQENVSMPLQMEPPIQQSSLSYADYNLFAPNMYAFNGTSQQQPLSTHARNLLEEMVEKEALAQRQAEKAQQNRNTQFLLDFVSSMGRGRRSSSELSNRMSPLFNMLASSDNIFDDGGGIRRMYDADTGELGNIVRVDNAGNYLVDYNGDVRPMTYQGPEYTVTGKYNREKLTEEEKENVALAKVMEMRENRHLDDPLVGGELKDNQYNTEVPQWMVDHYADMIAEQTAPGILDMIEGGVMLPQQLLSPSHWAGVVRNWDSDKGWDNIWEPNSGFVSREYAEEHPWKTMGINMVGDIIAGEVGKDILNGVRIGRNIMDRNKFVYKYLEPASYYNIKDRAKNVVNHILHDRSFAKGEIPEKVEDIGLPLEFRKELNSTPAIGIFRDESLRKYLGLPERLGLYIDNGDGTWRYNKDVVKRVLKENGINITDEELEKFPALINPSRFLRRMADAVEDGKNADIDVLDFLTSSGGNSKMKFKGRKPTWVQDEYGTDIGTAWEYSADLEDPWDVNPFAPWNEGITGPSLSTMAGDYVRDKADDLYTSLYDLLYKHQFANDYLGGKFLNDIRYTFDISNYPKLKKMLDKIGEKEVGKILGGEPFMMRTPVTFKKWQGKDRPIIFDFDY